MMTGRAATI